jgi:hypothetical protein
MSFTESNTVEQMILDAATSLGSGAGSFVLGLLVLLEWGRKSCPTDSLWLLPSHALNNR